MLSIVGILAVFLLNFDLIIKLLRTLLCKSLCEYIFKCLGQIFRHRMAGI